MPELFIGLRSKSTRGPWHRLRRRCSRCCVRQVGSLSREKHGERGLPNLRTALLLGAAVFLCTCTVRAQQTGGSKGIRERADAYGGVPGQKEAKRPAWRGDDIVADNLDRVAATADQILEVVNKDTGLIVELKSA